ncbi:lipase [Pseudomassariella vexata]|uniref:sn-1-specific diacylglycerol lipase n=1 Tax=Pseudomassariella vexata TaxID=1141098 RepID=A0A1Y2DPR2_9PEZI|nr:lipase [Pseudomassariella vexata]ORY60655.1 lipase [Pseudomassariella vexata]
MDPDDSADDVGDELIPFDDTNFHDRDLIPASPGRTLLPSPIASAVSFATRSTSLALRVGTFIGGYSLSAAKFTTLSSLELGRGILEGILSRAGRDVIVRSRSELGRDNAETILERSLENLHQTMTQIVFWTTTGFHITGTTVSTVSQISHLFLSVLDQFFGSTDSSKAIASIITLIRREFQNPATGVQGERVGVVDLILGLCGLAYLQNWCRRMIQEETRRLGHEEVIWDVVVLNDGERVDVHEDSLYGVHKGRYGQASAMNNSDGIIEAIEQHGAQDSGSEDELPEIHLKRQIMGSLPKDASVSISTATNTTKTITVEIKGTPDVPLLAPPGADVIESEITTPDVLPSGMRDSTPTYRVVYRISRNKMRSTAMQRRNDEDTPRVEVISDSDEKSVESPPPRDYSYQDPPPVPPKPMRSTTVPVFSKEDSAAPDRPSRQHRSVSSTGSACSSMTSPKDRTSQIPVPKPTPENAANQKRIRQPLGGPKRAEEAPAMTRVASKASSKPPKDAEAAASMKVPEKRGGLRNVWKKGSVQGIANLLNKDSSSENVSTVGKQKQGGIKPPWGSYKPSQNKSVVSQSRVAVPERNASMLPAREPPRPPQRGNPNFFSSRDLGHFEDGSPVKRSQSRSSYVAVHERRRNSTVSQTDTFSIHSFESRPTSPTYYRTEYRSSNMSKSKSGNDIVDLAPPSPPKHHHRARSQVGSMYSPSIYTLKTGGSQTSLVLSSYHQKSAYSDSEAVDTLRRTGMVDGMFPSFHILRNITRYSRYASAAYGSNFLKMMGIAKEMPVLKALDEMHQDVRSFAQHTELPPDSILLSSFVDPQGGSDSTGSTDTGVPLVHTVSLDEESKAVVLACRGTLGFEDVLADMMCEYDDLLWRGKTYKVHKGIHASARRLLYGGDGRVLVTLKEALEEFPDYGLILCGHSLGGAVTALLGVMLAEPATMGTAFVTSAQQYKRLLTDGHTSAADTSHICLPSGRPIHVYAYGPPATMSPSLQKATRGLITSTVHGNDLVPYLSLGVLHDFQALALAFKTDNSDAKAEVRRRIWEGLQSGLADRWYNNAPKSSNGEEDKWAYAALKTLRATMMSSKLLPPGEVFAVESTPALRRDAFLQAGEEQIGRPATRIVLKYVRDVEVRFREVRFGSSMLTDHSPGRYEDTLRRLTLGVVDS